MKTDATSTPMTESPPPAPPGPRRAPARSTRHLATALAVLSLGGCGAAAFGVGGGGATTTPHASLGEPGERTPPPLTIDPDDPITVGTDRANAATPDNAGRARTYPKGPDFTIEQIESYGGVDNPRGDGYYVSLRQRRAILAGYTVEIATKRARLTGFDGTIRVTEADKFDPSCADGIVCSIYPQEWQGSGEAGQLILFVNRHMQISSPD